MLQHTSSEVTVKTITPSFFLIIKRDTGDKLRKVLTERILPVVNSSGIN